MYASCANEKKTAIIYMQLGWQTNSLTHTGIFICGQEHQWINDLFLFVKPLCFMEPYLISYMLYTTKMPI